MVSNVINLRTVRKRKAKSQVEDRVAENRLKFGRDKSQKLEEHRESGKAARRHDGQRLDKPENK
jgi:hypothetical protein